MPDNDLDAMLAGLKAETAASRRAGDRSATGTNENEGQPEKSVPSPRAEKTLKRQAESIINSDRQRKYKITSLSLDEAFHWELKKFAFENRTTMVAVIEKAVREYMRPKD